MMRWPWVIGVVLVAALIGESYLLYSIIFDFRPPRPDVGFTGPTKDRTIWWCDYKLYDLNLNVRFQADGAHLNEYHGQHKIVEILVRDDDDMLIGAHFSSWESPGNGPTMVATLTEIDKRTGEFLETQVFRTQGQPFDTPVAKHGSCHQE